MTPQEEQEKKFRNKYAKQRDINGITYEDRYGNKKTDFSQRPIMRSDGDLFESTELDGIFRFLRNKRYGAIEDAPQRVNGKVEREKWHVQNSKKDLDYKVVHINDPESFYMRNGLYSSNPFTPEELKAHELQAPRPPLPTGYGEYELWTFRRTGKYGNEWKQIPLKDQYLTVFENIHSKFHEGRETSHNHFTKRYWFPFCKVYFEDFMIHCPVC